MEIFIKTISILVIFSGIVIRLRIESFSFYFRIKIDAVFVIRIGVLIIGIAIVAIGFRKAVFFESAIIKVCFK